MESAESWVGCPLAVVGEAAQIASELSDMVVTATGDCHRRGNDNRSPVKGTQGLKAQAGDASMNRSIQTMYSSKAAAL